MRARRFAWLLVVLVVTTRWFGPSSGQQPPAAEQPAQPVQVTSQPGQEIFPSLAPDGRLVYSRIDGGDWDIFLQRAGASPVNLTADSPADDWQAEFSPDGKRLAFRSERDDGGIFIMDAGGGSLERLTRSGFNPTWSPDGTQVLYSTAQVIADPTTRPVVGVLSMIRVATGERRTVYDDSDAVQPRFSPSGKRIAFWGFPNQGGQRDIWTIAAPAADQTGAGLPPKPVAVTQDAATDWNPVWSPDGTYLYFASDRGGSMEIWRVRIDEATGQVQRPPEQMTQESGGLRGHIVLADNGARMLYVDQRLTPIVERVGFDAAAGRIVGEPKPILYASLAPTSIDTSPDGRSLAFYSAGSQQDVYVSSAEGESQRRLTNDPARDRGPAWSPDGRRIAFFSDRSGSYEIWTINPDGTALTLLTNTPGANRSTPIWSPDGSRMLYIQRRGASWDTYIIDPAKPASRQVVEQLPAIGGSDEYFTPTSWSPDGKMLVGNRAFTDRTTPGGIFVYTLATKTFQMVLDRAAGARWLNDNRRVIYPDNAAKKILLLDTQSRETRDLLAVPRRDIGAIRLSSDNRTLYINLSTTQSNILQLTVDRQ